MSCVFSTLSRRHVALAVDLVTVCVISNPVQAQFGAGFRNSSVGGVKIDTEDIRKALRKAIEDREVEERLDALLKKGRFRTVYR